MALDWSQKEALSSTFCVLLENKNIKPQNSYE